MRLLDDMATQRDNLRERGGLYSSTGERELARLASKAAFAITDAIRAVEAFHAAEGEALNQAKEG